MCVCVLCVYVCVYVYVYVCVCVCVYAHFYSNDRDKGCGLGGALRYWVTSHTPDQASAHHTIDPEEDGAMSSVNDPEENDEHEPDILNGHKHQLTWGQQVTCAWPSAIRSKAQSPQDDDNKSDPLCSVRPPGERKKRQ
ncbi:hypothetical protein STEG23_006920 [Scotinomys teguina]